MSRISSDPLKAFVALRSSLEAKRTALLSEVADIEAALGSLGVAAPSKGKARTAVTARPQGKRAKNELSLKEAVIQALGQSSLGKDDILSAIKKLGYKFSAKNPTNSLNTVLYGKKPKFKNVDGKFSVA
ncbi:MAG TPA: hypothetical protein VMB21_21045 [Candidatus Limnocylindria bacterium]|nr:hypothetical protein [Candidatus Limnocylindria bacterium]